MARSPITTTTGKEIKAGSVKIYVGRIRIRANGKKEVQLHVEAPEPIKHNTKKVSGKKQC